MIILGIAAGKFLELPVSNVGVNDEAAKEQGEFVEEEVAPTSPNLWGDTEGED